MSPLHQQKPSLESDLALHSTSLDGAGSTIVNIVFGILALVVGVATIWLAYCTYRVWYPTTIDINHGASRTEEPETRAEMPDGDNISLEPQTSEERQNSNSNDGGLNDSIGLPSEHSADFP